MTNTTVTGSEEVDLAIGCAGFLLSLGVSAYLVYHVFVAVTK